MEIVAAMMAGAIILAIGVLIGIASQQQNDEEG
jgi:hypothetical protein